MLVFPAIGLLLWIGFLFAVFVVGGIVWVFCQVVLVFVSVVKLFADRGYRGTLLNWLVSVSGGHATLEIVKPAADRVGFGVDPKRWIVERTISWLCWSRRLSKDYELYTEVSEATIYGSLIRLMVKRLAT